MKILLKKWKVESKWWFSSGDGEKMRWEMVDLICSAKGEPIGSPRLKLIALISLDYPYSPNDNRRSQE